jgi:hypothetical protein
MAAAELDAIARSLATDELPGLRLRRLLSAAVEAVPERVEAQEVEAEHADEGQGRAWRVHTRGIEVSLEEGDAWRRIGGLGEARLEKPSSPVQKNHPD